ncbi:hypothetical protein GQX74_011391 [Glossina fuscipes]|nr:hypothetical protein GQX74_011391 [Glossina fuscipes]
MVIVRRLSEELSWNTRLLCYAFSWMEQTLNGTTIVALEVIPVCRVLVYADILVAIAGYQRFDLTRKVNLFLRVDGYKILRCGEEGKSVKCGKACDCIREYALSMRLASGLGIVYTLEGGSNPLSNSMSTAKVLTY